MTFDIDCTTFALPPPSCVTLSDEAEGAVATTPLGRIASFYYLQHATMIQLGSSMRAGMGPWELLQVMMRTGGATRAREERAGLARTCSSPIASHEATCA